jgi:hypothetical protein
VGIIAIHKNLILHLRKTQNASQPQVQHANDNDNMNDHKVSNGVGDGFHTVIADSTKETFVSESMAETMDHIVNQLAMISQTLSLMDQRLSSLEDKMDFIENAGFKQNPYEHMSNSFKN